MTRLASLALLLACSLPALGQGLILGAPAQGAAGGGGSGVVETITETGSGLTVDSTDPANPVLSLGAVLEAIANLSGTDNQLVRMDGTGDLQASDATLSDAELLDLTVTGALSLGTGTNDVRLEKGTTNRWHLRSGDDDEWAGLVLNLLAAGDSTLDVEAVLSATSLTAANTRLISLTNSAVPSLRAYAASATAGNGNYMAFARFGGTLASPTAVTNGDTILGIYGRQACTASITGDLEAAAITMETDGAVGAGDSPGRIAFWTNGDGAGNTATKRWTLNNAGHWLAFADNSYDIGASGATRPRTIYAGTRFLGPAGSASAATWGFSATTGMFGVDATSISLTINNTEEQRLTASALDRGPDQVVFGASLGSPDAGIVREAAGILRVSDASTGSEDLMVDNLIVGQRSGNGFMFESTGNGNLSIIDGDGTALAGSGETINFGNLVLQSDAASASNPSYSFASDLNTGMYRVGADDIGFSTGGTIRLGLNSSGVRATDGFLILGAAGAGGMRLEGNASQLNFTNGDGSDLEDGNIIQFGITAGRPVIQADNDGSASLPNYSFSSDGNTGLGRVEADAPAIAAEGQWRHIISNTLTITEGTASNLVTIPLASGAAVAGSMRVFIGLTDGTDTIRMVRAVHFTAIDKGGVLTSSINTDGSTVGHSTNGGYTVDDGPTFAVADGTNAISITLDVGATGTNTVTVAWTLDLHHSAAGQLVTIP